MGDPEKAYHYAARHLQISKETGDRMGQATAQVKKLPLQYYPADNQCCGSGIRNPVLIDPWIPDPPQIPNPYF
jgi:hypothetical protein